MKTKTTVGGFVLRSAAATLLFCFLLAAVISSGKSASSSGRTKTLTFAERVAYQRLIEDVYWSHRIWPKDNHNPKPSLDAVMSHEEIEKKVENYLRNSQALEGYWQEPITRDQLQGEMERIATHTKQPMVLREIFAALGNDPFVIAECLARPILTDRLITQVHADDRRFYSESQWRTGAESRADPTVRQMKKSSGRYPETEWIKSAFAEFGAVAESGASASDSINPMQEDQGHYDAGLTEKGKPVPVTISAVSGDNYRLPAVANNLPDACSVPWIPTGTTGTPAGRQDHTAVWTGSEMIVWGGYTDFSSAVNTGGRYNPATDSWTLTSTTDAPRGRHSHTAVWTGSQMIVWGGNDGFGGTFNTGGKYNPSTDTWTATSTLNAPDGGIAHTAVWTGSQMIVWGGYNGSSSVNTGGKYNPSTDTWMATSPPTRLLGGPRTRQSGLAGK